MFRSAVLTYRAPISSSRSAFRYGAGVRPKAVTSRPRSRSTSDASSPSVPVPMTAARRGRQTRSRRCISYACVMPFCATVIGSSSTPTSLSPLGTLTTKSSSLDVVLGEVAVTQVDAALEVLAVGRHVLEADGVVEAVSRAPHRGDDVIAGSQEATPSGRPPRPARSSRVRSRGTRSLPARRPYSAALISRSVPSTPTLQHPDQHAAAVRDVR